MYRPRDLATHLLRLSRQYPVVTVTGPRQSGKSVLCRNVFSRLPVFSLENPDVRRRAIFDPNEFVRGLGRGAIIDEVQRAPELFSYLQTRVDSGTKVGTFILTGSAQLELMSSVSQSLAGRTALVKLLPFSLEEAYPQKTPSIDTLIYTGFYPRIFDKKLNPTEAMAFYTATYLEKDIRTLVNVRDLSKFHTFLKLCAARTGQILNLSALGNDCGVEHATIQRWISVLETTFITYRLRPFFRNFGKRLVKAPKLYFLDTGLACYLLEIENPKQLAHHPLRGALFETFVVGELLKRRYNNVKESNLYYWRDNTGNEIDVVMDFGNTVFPVEIKSGETLSSDSFKNIRFLKKIEPSVKRAALIYGGNHSHQENDISVLSYRSLRRNNLKNLPFIP